MYHWLIRVSESPQTAAEGRDPRSADTQHLPQCNSERDGAQHQSAEAAAIAALKAIIERIIT